MNRILYETDRLIIREWCDSDYLDLYEYCSDEEVTKFLSFDTYKSTDDAIDRIKSLKESTEEILKDYAIELKGANKVIGSIGIVQYSPKHFGQVEIGYILNPKFQGNGYMTEALKGMFRSVFDRGIAKRIVLKHDVLNEKSGNVMKRAGMTFEGIIRKAGGENHLHSRYDIAQYSFLEEDLIED